MASFRTHISFGIALGVLGCVALITAAITHAPLLLVAVFALATLGSVLPDMDSDSGVPFHVAFGSLTVVVTVLAFLSAYKTAPVNWRLVLIVTGGAAVFVWGIVGYVFKRITRHRGMAHSLPAALLAGLITFFLASRLYFSDQYSFMLGTAIVLGYVLHLALDELYAAVNFHGTLFIPNKAFGSALKVKSDSLVVNAAVYTAIFFLLAGNVQRLWGLAEGFWKQLGL